MKNQKKSIYKFYMSCFTFMALIRALIFFDEKSKCLLWKWSVNPGLIDESILVYYARTTSWLDTLCFICPRSALNLSASLQQHRSLATCSVLVLRSRELIDLTGDRRAGVTPCVPASQQQGGREGGREELGPVWRNPNGLLRKCRRGGRWRDFCGY